MRRLFLAAVLLVYCGSAHCQPPESFPQAAAGAGTTSANRTGSLGSLCSSYAGIVSLICAASLNSPPLGFNATIASNLSTTTLQQIAEVAWNYIVTFPSPVLAKSLAGGSANATAINTFHTVRLRLSTYTDTSVVTPNSDILYISTFLDLSQGPQIITVPQFDSRYWVLPFLDAGLNFYAGIGSNYNSTAGEYLVVGRGAANSTTYGSFTNERILRSPTDINWVIARILVRDDADLSTAAAYGRALSVRPFDPAVNGSLNASSKAAIISRSVNGSGWGVYQNPTRFLSEFTKQPAQWFNVSATVLEADPPGDGSGNDLVTTLRALSQNATDPSNSVAYQLGYQISQQCVLNGNTALVTNTGWTYQTRLGNYTVAGSTDYLLRAQDTLNIFGTLPAKEVIYFFTTKDSQNRTLDASRGANYTITFALPMPASGFWSLTIYNLTSLLLFQNPIDRYTIGDRTPGLVYSGTNNNTLQVYISASQPALGSAEYANWLPAPANSRFELILRTYVPPASTLLGQYVPPPVILAEATSAVGSSG